MRANGTDHRRCVLGVTNPGDDHLKVRSQHELETGEEVCVGGRGLADGIGKGGLHPVCRLLEFKVRRHPPEGEDGVHGHAVPGGDCPVVDSFLADGGVPVVRREEESSPVAVPVMSDKVPGEFDGGPEVAGRERSFIDLKESPEHKRIIVEGRGDPGFAVPIAVEEPPVGPAKVRKDE